MRWTPRRDAERGAVLIEPRYEASTVSKTGHSGEPKNAASGHSTFRISFSSAHQPDLIDRIRHFRVKALADRHLISRA